MQNSDKLYYSFNEHLRNHFGKKVFKISVDLGLSCPNRDGTFDTNGCTYCNELGSAAIGINSSKSLIEQINEGKEVIRSKYKANNFLVYFQAHTNTYAKPKFLLDAFNTALEQENVLGIIIGTRPDCFNDEIYEILEEINKRTYLWVELGLQSTKDATLNLINRHHNFEDFQISYKKLKTLGIRVGVHLIFGLPNEDFCDMLNSVKEMAKLKIDGIKLHLLTILSNTQIGEMYKNNQIKPLTMSEYIKIICDSLEVLPAETIILRLTGDPVRTFLLAPNWSIKKFEVLNAINNELKKRESFQGKFYNK